jgi:hypothetical protein
LKTAGKKSGKKAGVKRANSSEELLTDDVFLNLLPESLQTREVIVWIDKFFKCSKKPADFGSKNDYQVLAEKFSLPTNGTVQVLIKRILSSDMYVSISPSFQCRIHCTDPELYAPFNLASGKRKERVLVEENVRKVAKMEAKDRDQTLRGHASYVKRVPFYPIG